MHRSLLVAVAVVAAATVAAASAVFLPRAHEQTARPELQHIIDNLVTGPDRIAPGAVAYVSGPKGTWVGAAGLANVAALEQMRTDARMRLESVSKLWVATLIVRLSEAGKLRLDDTVEHWLPGVLPDGARITIRQLLNHTSGLVDSNDIVNSPELYLEQVRDPALHARLMDVARHLTKDPAYVFPSRLWVDFAAAVPLGSEPGTTFHYSNIGYVVAGLVAERAGGASLARLTETWITKPLDLHRAAYDPNARISGSHTQGYKLDRGHLTNTTTWTQGLGANGGMVADAADEAHFLQAVMSGKLVSPRGLGQITRAPYFSSYGLGVGSEDSGCAGLAYGHNGGGDGFETNVYVSANGKRVTVLLLNGRTADDSGDRVAYDAMQSLYCAA